MKKFLFFLCFSMSSTTFASEIKMFGDSLFKIPSGVLASELESIFGLDIDNKARSGALSEEIKHQYFSIKDAPISLAIIGGGANDAFANSSVCKNQFGDACKKVIDCIAANFKEMLEVMTAHGVRDVVFLSYYHIPYGFAEAIDYGYVATKKVCDEAEVHCVIVDPRHAFWGHPEYIRWDGIHPTKEGAKVLAQLIWDAYSE
jgi:lysophospholipase L1-like esterase